MSAMTIHCGCVSAINSLSLSLSLSLSYKVSSLTDNVKINQAKSSRLSKSSAASFHLMWVSGRVFDSRPRGRGFEPHRRHCVVSLSKNINPSLVMVQPRKTRLLITERLLMGHKESNQTFHRIYSCADPEGRGSAPHPGKPQVRPIWLSIEFSIWTPLEKGGPPGKCWPPLDPWKRIVFSVIKPLDPVDQKTVK